MSEEYHQPSVVHVHVIMGKRALVVTQKNLSLDCSCPKFVKA